VSDPVAYGGQAVIEGVMMRGQRHFAVACRRADGEIVLRQEAVPAFFTRYRWARWPLLRGVFALADALVLGMKSLLFSADLATKDMVGTAGPAETPERNGRGVPASIAGIAVPASSFVGMLFALGLFVLLPSWAADWLRPWLHPSDLVLNLTEGGIRIALVLGYIWTIGHMKEVKRLFRYHGAEHKAINGLEQEGVADVDVAMRQSRIHPRCGTNFVLTVLLIKVGVFALFGWQTLWLRLLLRVLLLPVVAAVAYELIRLAGKYRDVPGIQLLVLPGLLTQRLTTAEPDRGMVEVAVASLRSVLRREQPEQVPDTEAVVVPV